MRFAYLLALASLSTLSLGAVVKRADCGGGRSASDAKCCVWYDVLDDLQADLFHPEPCGKAVHESLRLSFHDAIGYSESLLSEGKYGGGGADGSIIIHRDVELAFPLNKGLDSIVDRQLRIGLSHNIPYGDLVQFAAAVGITDCPGSPRLEFLAGRDKETQPSPEGMLPDAAASVDTLIERHADAGFSANDMVDLLIAHTIGGQEHINPSTPNTPFDTTQMVFDTQFFIETLLNGTSPPFGGVQPGEAVPPLNGAFRLASDHLIARDPRTACRWQLYANDQELMRQRFRAVMSKLAVLGHDRDGLVDCSEVIPEVREVKKKPFLPAGKTMDHIEASCPDTPFPTLTADPGPETAVHPEKLPGKNETKAAL
ncbi:hypothetical protein AAF712_008972 [Marasmius tenuissimus]|uniref:Peroxidase n=1 Tax=Marasmius tenuissimus TaxID=585030 RepID=A0ABR2ZQZ9_9AGAR